MDFEEKRRKNSVEILKIKNRIKYFELELPQ